MLLHSESTEERDGQTAEPWRSEWSEVHCRLREYARHRAALDAAEAFDLARAEQLKIHFLCGCATMSETVHRPDVVTARPAVGGRRSRCGGS